MLNATFLAKLVHEQAKVYGNKTVMSYRDYEKNEWIWNDGKKRHSSSDGSGNGIDDGRRCWL